MRRDAALLKGVEAVLDEWRRAGARRGFDLGEEGRKVLPHQAVERRLLCADAVRVRRGTNALSDAPERIRARRVRTLDDERALARSASAWGSSMSSRCARTTH